MLISMTPNEEVKTIHASLNDGSLRKWEFEPYTENGKIDLTDQDYATIQSIKGNTLKFNQLFKNGNFADGTNNWNANAGTLTANNNILEYTVTILDDSNWRNSIRQSIELDPSNKYLISFDILLPKRAHIIIYYGGNYNDVGIIEANNWTRINAFVDVGATKNYIGINIGYMAGAGYVVGDIVKLKNANLHNLTAMGIDNLTTTAEVEEWLSNNIGLLPYYDYTLGTLISFKGTGLKTENASQTESNTLSLPISTYFPTGMKEAGTVYDEISDKAYTRVGSITLDGSENWNWSQPISGGYRYYVNIDDIATNISDSNVANVVCANYKTKAYEQSSFINQYPMITGRYNVTQVNFFVTSITSLNDWKIYLSNNPITVFYELASPTSQDISLDLTYPVWNGGTEQILPVNSSTPTTSPMVATIEYPDRTEEVNFLYKQTAFDSAIPQFSLVCKNQELPMALEDGKLICECDSSITNESGFFDCKVKMQDLNSVAYSQKIQLHVERGIND